MSKYLPFDQLLSYQPLFIKDVTTADIESDQPLTLKTRHKLLFQKLKINGLIVARQDIQDNKMNNATRCILYLDDSSAVIPVHLPQRVYNRKCSVNLKIGTSMTVFGEPQQHLNSVVIMCKGYRIEDDPHVDIRHSLQVISNHNDRNSTKSDMSAPTQSFYISNGRKRQKPSDSNVFTLLSSQPSSIRGPTENLYPSPIHNNKNDDDSRDDQRPVAINSQTYNHPSWHWSPDNIAATSTPIKLCLIPSPKYPSPKYSRASPLRLSQKIARQQLQQQDSTSNSNKNKNSTLGDDSEFGFDSQFDELDLDDIENKALEARAEALK